MFSGFPARSLIRQPALGDRYPGGEVQVLVERAVGDVCRPSTRRDPGNAQRGGNDPRAVGGAQVRVVDELSTDERTVKRAVAVDLDKARDRRRHERSFFTAAAEVRL